MMKDTMMFGYQIKININTNCKYTTRTNKSFKKLLSNIQFTNNYTYLMYITSNKRTFKERKKRKKRLK